MPVESKNPNSNKTENGNSAQKASSDRSDRQTWRWRPRDWALWQSRPRVIIFVFVMSATAIIAFMPILANSSAPSTIDWIRFGILAVGATIHTQFTQRQEERRRAGSQTVLIDLTAVWAFPAVLVLPVPLTILLIVSIRAQRWFIGRRPVHTFVFATIGHCLAGSVAHVTYVALGPHDWTNISLLGGMKEFCIIVLIGLIDEAIQIAYISGFLALRDEKFQVKHVLGNKADNLLEAITTGLGAINAILLVTLPPTVAIMAVVTVVFNRLAEMDQLQSEARTDPKTQVYNMRGWHEFANRGLTRAIKSGRRAAVLMIDLDRFKSINDDYGHPAGDDVLRAVAQVINETTRPSDVVGRFGGEEFLVLMPNIDRQATLVAAERIRRTIAELRIPTTDKRGAPITVAGRTTSIGVSVYPDHGASIEALLHAADAAVYQAKEGGRNQIRVAPDSDGEPAVPTSPTPVFVERRKSQSGEVPIPPGEST